MTISALIATLWLIPQVSDQTNESIEGNHSSLRLFTCLEDLKSFGLDPRDPYRPFVEGHDEDYVKDLLADKKNHASKHRLALGFMPMAIAALKRWSNPLRPDFETLLNQIYLRVMVRGIERFNLYKRVHTSDRSVLGNLAAYIQMRIRYLTPRIVQEEYWHHQKEIPESFFINETEGLTPLERAVGMDEDQFIDEVDGFSPDEMRVQAFEKIDQLLNLFFKHEEIEVAQLNGRLRPDAEDRIKFWRAIIDRWKMGVTQAVLAKRYNCSPQSIWRYEKSLKTKLFEFLRRHPDSKDLRAILKGLGFTKEMSADPGDSEDQNSDE